MFIYDQLPIPIQSQTTADRAEKSGRTGAIAFSELLGEFQALVASEEDFELLRKGNEKGSGEEIESEELAVAQQEMIALLTALLTTPDERLDVIRLVREARQDQFSTPNIAQEIQGDPHFEAKVLSIIQLIEQNGLESIPRNATDELTQLIQMIRSIESEERTTERLVLQSDEGVDQNDTSQKHAKQVVLQQVDTVKLQDVMDRLIAKLDNQLVILPQPEIARPSVDRTRMFSSEAPVGIYELTIDEVAGQVEEVVTNERLQDTAMNSFLEEAPQRSMETIFGRSQLETGQAPSFQNQLNRFESATLKPDVVPIQSERFLPQMTEFLVSKLQFSTSADGTEARVLLYPEQLGHVDVRITVQQGQMVAQFIAESNLGKDLLEAHLAALRSSLQQQGVQVNRIDVQTAAEASLLNQQHQHQQDRSGAFQQNQQNKRFSSAAAGLQRPSHEEMTGVYDRSLGHTVDRTSYSDTKIDITA